MVVPTGSVRHRRAPSPVRSTAGGSSGSGRGSTALGHDAVVEQHEILCRFVQGDIGCVQLIEELARWFSAYMENCQGATTDELLHGAA